MSGLLFDIGCCGLQDEEDTPDAGVVRLTAYFSSSRDTARTLRDLQKGLQQMEASGLPATGNLSSACLSVSEVPEEDWSAGWREHFAPVPASPRVVVCAPWHRVQPPPGGCVVVIEPKMAFGTGSHETTQLALRDIEDVLTPSTNLLDVGTGSGVLAIAAAKLGAGEALAVDTDPQAVENACENVVLNGVGHRVTVAEGSAADVVGVFDTVVANILTSVIIPMLPDLEARLGKRGSLVLGGILGREEAAVTSAVCGIGLSVTSVRHAGDWVGVAASRAE